jgi:hypothetical protein
MLTLERHSGPHKKGTTTLSQFQHKW